MNKKAYFQKAARMIAEPVSRETHQRRENYFLRKLAGNPEFQDNSIDLLNAVDKILVKNLNNPDETSAYAFTFIAKAMTKLETKTLSDQLHKMHTVERLDEIADQVLERSGGVQPSDFLISATKNFFTLQNN
jgi:hypothetical protein